MGNRWQVLAILIVGLAGPSAALAQGPGPYYPPTFANDPQPYKGPEFAPGTTQQVTDANAFSGVPDEPKNAFQDDCRPRKHVFERWIDFIVDPDPCPEPLTVYFKFDYLAWNFTADRINVPIATTAVGTPNLTSNNGSIGQSGTRILFGNTDVDYGVVSGGKFTVGTSVFEIVSLELNVIVIPEQNRTLFSATSNADSVLARPVFGTNLPSAGVAAFFPGAPTVFLSGFGPSPSNFYSGNITVQSSLSFWGVEPSAYLNLCCFNNLNLFAGIGYRYINFEESLTINSTSTPTFVTPGNSFGGQAVGTDTTVVSDSFSTTNQFNGVNLGIRSAFVVSRFALTLDGKLGIGAASERLNVNGVSTLIDPSGSLSLPGGILALPSNMGSFSHTTFTVIPEFDAYASFTLSPNLQFFLGYNFMYWPGVVRPGNQLSNYNSQVASPGINTQQAPTDINYTGSSQGPPNQTFTRSDLFINGASIGFLIGW